MLKDMDLTDVETFDEAPTVVVPPETMAEFVEQWQAERTAAIASSERPTRNLRAVKKEG